ncbi:MAG: hypothetical protein ACRD2T_10515 [Thermoanaerobaculia bacterium]
MASRAAGHWLVVAASALNPRSTGACSGKATLRVAEPTAGLRNFWSQRHPRAALVHIATKGRP